MLSALTETFGSEIGCGRKINIDRGDFAVERGGRRDS